MGTFSLDCSWPFVAEGEKIGGLQAGSESVCSEVTQATYSHITLAKAGHMTTPMFTGVGKDNLIEKDSIGRDSKYFKWKYNLPYRTFDKIGHAFLKKSGEFTVT